MGVELWAIVVHGGYIIMFMTADGWNYVHVLGSGNKVHQQQME